MVSAKSWSAQHRLCEITSREITHRDDVGLVGGKPRRGAGTSRRWRWRERVPWAGSTGRLQRTGDPLYGRRDGTP